MEMDMTADDDAEWMTTPEAAKRYKVSESFLNNLRHKGGGPPFFKFGGRVLYRRSDFDAWLLERRQLSTTRSIAF